MSLHFSGQHGYVSIQGQTQWCRSMLAWSVCRTHEGKEFVCKLHQDGVELLWLEDYQKQKKICIRQKGLAHERLSVHVKGPVKRRLGL